MAIVGWIRGYKTQGTARSIIQIDLETLRQKLVKRFVRTESLLENELNNVYVLVKVSWS